MRLEVLSDNLGRDIKSAVQKSFSGTDKDFNAAGQRAGKSVSQGVSKGIDDNHREVDTSASKMGNSISKNLTAPMEQSFSKNVKTSMRTGLRGADSVADTETKKTGKKIENVFTRSFNNIKTIAKVTGKFISGALIYAKPAEFGAAGALVAAELSKVIPAAAGIGAALTAGAAIGVAGLASLATSAGFFLLGLKADVEGMAEVKKGFSNLKTELSQPIGKAMLPGLQSALGQLQKVVKEIPDQLTMMGKVWGDVMARMASEAAKPTNIARLKSIMTDSAAATLNVGEAAAQLTTSLLILGKAAQPMIQYFSEGALKMATWLRTTLEAKEANGELTTSITRMLDRWKLFWATIKNFGAGVANIFRAALPTADKMGQHMLTISQRFQEWTGKPANMARMTAFFDKMRELAAPIGELMGDIGKRIGLALEGMDIAPLVRMVTKIRTTLLPAVQDLFGGIQKATGPGFEKTFNNIVDGFARIVDSGNIQKVSGWVAEFSTNISALLDTDLGGWLTGVALAVLPFAGMASAIGGLGALGLALKAFTLLRLGGLVTRLSGVTKELGALSRLNLAGTMAGLSAGVATGVTGAVGAGTAAGAAAAVSKGPSFLGLTKGLLKGGIVVWIASEILGAFSPEFKSAWDDLMAKVMDAGKESGATAVKALGGALGAGLNLFTGMIDYLTGDLPAARAKWQEAKDWWDKDVIGWLKDPNTLNPSVNTADTIGDFLKGAAAAVDAANVRADWDKIVTQTREGIQAVVSTMNSGGPEISTSVGGILNILNQINVTKHPALRQFRDAIARSITGIVEDFATNNPHLLEAATTMNTILDQAVQADPSFGPGAAKIKEWLAGLTAEFNHTEGLQAAVGHLKGFLSSPTLSSNFSTDPFKSVKEGIRTSLQGVIDEIESGGPNVQGKVAELMAAINAAPKDMPGFEAWKTNIIETLKAAGVDIPAALQTTTEKTKGAAGSFSSVVGAAMEQARQEMATKLGQIFATFQIREMPTLTPLADSIRKGLDAVGQAFVTNAPDLQTKVNDLIADLNLIPATGPLAPLRDQILAQLQAMGVDISSFSPTLASEGQGLGRVWGKSVPSGFQLGIVDGKLVVMSELDKFGSDIVGKLGGELPGLILGIKPAVDGAVTGALSGVPGIGILPFLNLNAQAGGIAGQLGSAILPGLLGAQSTVGSGLAPILPTGRAPFDQLGRALSGIVGGFPGLVAPGLGETARQPGSLWAGVPAEGQSPWITMSLNVLRTLMMLESSVEAILTAIANAVAAAWASIGAMNAAGIAGVTATAQTAMTAAAETAAAAEAVRQNALQIQQYIPAITQAVLLSNQALQAVQVQAQQAAIAASQAAQAAAAAAASKATAGAGVGAGILAMATGGVVTAPMIALIGESGRERVEPLDSQGLSVRDRAMISHIVSSTVNAVQTKGGVDVEVSLNPNGLENIMNAVVTRREDRLARRLQYGRPQQ